MNWLYGFMSSLDDAYDDLKSFIYSWFVKLTRPRNLNTLSTLLTAIATIAAAYASYKSYEAAEKSTNVANLSLRTTEKINAEANDRLRAMLTVKSIEPNKYKVEESSYLPQYKIDVLALSITFKNSGHNPASDLRITELGFNGFEDRSQNEITSDSEQTFVFIKRTLPEIDSKLHVAFSYRDQILRKCFFGQATFVFVRNPKKPDELLLNPLGINNTSKDDLLRIKSKAECNEHDEF